MIAGKLLSAGGGGTGASGSTGGSVQLAFISYAGTDGGLPSASCCGVIRIIDGATCTQLATLSETKVVGGSNLALGDLNQDGYPKSSRWRRAVDWSRITTSPSFRPFSNCGNPRLRMVPTIPIPERVPTNGQVPRLRMFSGDSRPEILVDGAIYSADGVRLTEGPGWSGYQQGLFPVVGDADMDGNLEIFLRAQPYRVERMKESPSR